MTDIVQNHFGSGDNVAGNKVVNINQAPDPQIKAHLLKKSQPVADGFLTELYFEIIAPYVVKNARVEARGNNISNLNISPQKTGAFMLGAAGSRVGYNFADIPNAGGAYLATVLSKTKEDIYFHFHSDI